MGRLSFDGDEWSPDAGAAPARSTIPATMKCVAGASDLHVLTMIQNPLRWRSRIENYRTFERSVKVAGAHLHTAEVVLGDRPFVLVPWWSRSGLRLRTDGELWQKEAALNALLRKLPRSVKYVAWVDADILFTRPDWAQETIEQLQHHRVVQMFSHSLDLDAQFRPTSDIAHGFAFSYLSGFPRITNPGPLPTSYADAKSKGVYWHSGFAWAARREVLDAVGGFLDIGIIGSGDWHMANAFIGEDGRVPATYHENYKRIVSEWAERSELHVRRDIGYVEGLVTHLFHGRKSDRQYQKRVPLLNADIFDPDADLVRESNGLWRLRDGNFELRDMIRGINRARREDG